jgi:hypothetical protein
MEAQFYRLAERALCRLERMADALEEKKEEREDVDPAVVEAARRIVDYLDDDERRSYEETEPEHRKHHIYRHVLTLKAWLGEPLYYYVRGKDGVDETWNVCGPDGKVLASFPFWDDEEGTEAQAKVVVNALNAYKATE